MIGFVNLSEIKEDTVTNEVFVTPPGKARMFVAFNFDIKTSTQAGKRIVGFEMKNAAGATFTEVLSPPFEKVSQTFGISAFIGCTGVPYWPQAEGKEPKEWGFTINMPLPMMWLPEKWEMKYVAPVKQSEDTFPLFRTYYLERDLTRAPA